MTRTKNNTPLDRALNYLSYRPRTEKEIRDKLGEDCTEELITKLKRYGYINDDQYAKDYIESRLRFRPRSKKLIALELKRKGITITVDTDDLEAAKLALSKKKNLKSKEQAFRFLASRGFSWDTIEKVTKNEYNEANVN